MPSSIRVPHQDAKWGPRVHQRIAHILNDGLHGVLLFSLVLYLKGVKMDTVASVFVYAWLLHFIHRGFIHPLVMHYSRPTVTLGIPLTGLTLAFFAYLHADFLATCRYQEEYILDMRFIGGGILFITGYLINREADWKLRNLRNKSGKMKYIIPHGGLFHWISCPNYFGEMLQWLGWAVATCAPCGIIYFLFTTATFIPRAWHNHQWYLKTFKSYPSSRKSLIPFLL